MAQTHTENSWRPSMGFKHQYVNVPIRAWQEKYPFHGGTRQKMRVMSEWSTEKKKREQTWEWDREKAWLSNICVSVNSLCSSRGLTKWLFHSTTWCSLFTAQWRSIKDEWESEWTQIGTGKVANAIIWHTEAVLCLSIRASWLSVTFYTWMWKCAGGPDVIIV